jgi:hypothetical protein
MAMASTNQLGGLRSCESWSSARVNAIAGGQGAAWARSGKDGTLDEEASGDFGENPEKMKK